MVEKEFNTVGNIANTAKIEREYKIRGCFEKWQEG